MNIHKDTVQGFGFEWRHFDQHRVSDAYLRAAFDKYFAVFPEGALNCSAVGFDLGCGSGRWAEIVAPQVGKLHCIDASADALSVARDRLAKFPNCELHLASVDSIPIDDSSADFGYSLGVLHHVPDTLAGLKSCTAKLKNGAPFLIYLYYRFDNRPPWFRALWQVSNMLRHIISRLPLRLRLAVTTFIAVFVYWPLARTAWLLELAGIKHISQLPLAFYRHSSLYTMRTDALDRFGTSLEKRFTRVEIQAMMEKSGLRDIRFSENEPFWCAVGSKY
jgi:ubiquinone/menaquinone biosynthesis C-methylase UbiE